VDPLTHALASYTLKRAAFPRLGGATAVAMVLAGTVADLDLLFSQSSPSAYLTWHRTSLHSIAAAILFSAVLTLLLGRLGRQTERRIGFVSILSAAIAAALLHLFLDLGQSLGTELLWPFTPRRFSLDWLPKPDLYICTILLLAILLPKLAGLVTEEIGAKSTGPRGRAGAIVGLVAIFLYVVARAALHSTAVATLDARTYHGEAPRRIAAFPEDVSPFSWLGVVETERSLNEVTISLGPGSSFDPDSARVWYKPEPSAALDAALRTESARRFLAAVRFPKAAIEKTAQGYHVELHAFPYGSISASSRVMAIVDTDSASKVLIDSLEWDPAAQQHWWL
jgi:membrane-bound metal-dependent hydrolase YbcI (DUF457 family)